MKRILVLGAGMVAGAHVRYLLDQPDFRVMVASRTVAKAEAITRGHPRGRAIAVDSNDERALGDLIGASDVAVSLLPYAYHPVVARLCVKHRVPMVTTSYVKDAMAELDGAARQAGVILLNEIGVDPGIDHMSAMRVIHRAQADGGTVTAFKSWCGGLPAPEANTNPLGYKFSWSPRGVLLAGKNSAHYLMDGLDVEVPGAGLFDHRWDVPIEVDGIERTFEGYPNRDSLPYMATYGIRPAQTMFRGTLRNPGWCQTMKAIVQLGWVDEKPREGISGLTFGQLTAMLVGSRGDLHRDVAKHLELPVDSPVLERIAWLGLLGDDPLPANASSPIDILTARMLERMSFEPGERDLLLMQHHFEVIYPKHVDRIVSTMVDFGIPGGDSSMARTVGLPAAIGVRLILEGKIDLVGVQTPVMPEIYEPVLDELEANGIAFTEVRERIPA